MIGILGATGHTGVKLARVFQRLGQPMLLGGRDADKLDRLSSQVAPAGKQLCEIRDKRALRRFFEQCDLVVNCVGPYTTLGWEACQVALESETSLFDLTGEQGFQRRCIEKLDDGCKELGVVIANAMGLEVVVADCAAELLLRRHPEARVVHVVNHVRDFASSGGSRQSLAQVFGQSSVAWRDGGIRDGQRVAGRLRRARVGSLGARWMAWGPGVEILCVAQKAELDRVEAWFEMPAPVAASSWLNSRAMSASAGLLQKAAALWTRPIGVSKPGPWLIQVSVESEQELGAIEVRGVGPYEITAEITAWCAREFLQRGPVSEVGGVLPPAAVVDAERFFEAHPQLEVMET